MTAELRIAYLTSAFARPGDTFIRNEVNELRRLGTIVDTYSIRRSELAANADADVVAHQESTDFILEGGLAKLGLGTIRMVATHPDSIRQGDRTRRGGRRPRAVVGYCCKRRTFWKPRIWRRSCSREKRKSCITTSAKTRRPSRCWRQK